MTSSDRIEKKTVLKAPRSRVWRALTSAKEFGTWFGAKFETPFEPGKPARGRITNPDYDHLTIEIAVETMEPERLFSFRWHPYAIDPAVDYSKEPTTLVEFALAEVPEGTELTIVESGFDRIPAERRAEAFRMNEGGWTAQVKNIDAHVAT
ncbi:MAG TPA: SRPBCC family protein [Polyangiaceae bacterium]|jgi:uncharacterized protein YndB with AHSA1/START domain|nr:SRPBCC family protein [Polyangiaceae bacterium]